MPSTTPVSVGEFVAASGSTPCKEVNLGESGVENLDLPAFAQNHIGWLQVAMDDAALVGRGRELRRRYIQCPTTRSGGNGFPAMIRSSDRPVTSSIVRK